MATVRRTRTRVAFVTYEATRTGSPVLLLRLLRWLRSHSDLDLAVVCLRGGPLVDELRAVADVVVLAPLDRRTFVETLEAGAHQVGLHSVGRRLAALPRAIALRRQAAPDVVYLNGAPSFVALPHLRSAPVLGHIHELEFALGRSLPAGDEHLLGRADRYVAVARAVADNLTENHGIDPAQVSVQYGFVDDEAPEPADSPDDLRSRLGIPDEAPVIGAVGDLIWRKGPDLFVQLAASLEREGEDGAHFVWVGGRPGHGLYAEVLSDLEAMGLAARVHLVGEQCRPADWYPMFDLLALTSREDPFPLVVLEAARAGVPTVCFRQGGAPEFVEAEGGAAAGVVVADLDVAAMAAAIDALLADEARRAVLGRRALARVQDHHVTSVVAPRLLAEIEALL